MFNLVHYPSSIFCVVCRPSYLLSRPSSPLSLVFTLLRWSSSPPPPPLAFPAYFLCTPSRVPSVFFFSSLFSGSLLRSPVFHLAKYNHVQLYEVQHDATFSMMPYCASSSRAFSLAFCAACNAFSGNVAAFSRRNCRSGEPPLDFSSPDIPMENFLRWKNALRVKECEEGRK